MIQQAKNGKNDNQLSPLQGTLKGHSVWKASERKAANDLKKNSRNCYK